MANVTDGRDHNSQDDLHREDADVPSAEASAEWHEEDQEPVDGFSEHDGTVEEGAAVEEEAVEESEAETEEDASLPKRGSMLLPVLAAIFGILFVGGMMYSQFGDRLFGSSGGYAAPPLDTTQIPSAQVGPKPSSAGQPAEGLATTGSQFGAVPALPTAGNADPTSTEMASEPLTTVASLPTATPQPAATSSTSSSVPPQQGQSPSYPMPPSAPALAAVAGSGVDASQPNNAAQPQPKALPSDMARPLPQIQPAVPSSVSALDVSGIQTKIDALTARLDAVQKNLDQTVQQISQLSGAVTNIQAAGASANPVVAVPPDIVDRLTKLEQKVQTARTSPRLVLPSSSSAPAASARDAEPSVVTYPEESVPAKKHASRPAKAHHAEKKHSVREAKAHSWVLRAATPDAAWVAKSAGSSDLRQVEVGQTLSGIGKVKEIRQTAGGGWEVVGSQGSIR